MSMTAALRQLAVAAALSGWPAAAIGQSIVVQLKSKDQDRPLVGAVLTLLAPDGKIVKRTLTNRTGRGTFAVAAGRYRIRGDAIGYLSEVSEWLEVKNEDLKVTLSLERSSFVLKDLIVSSKSPCGKVSSASAIAALWVEARKALLATTLSTDQPPYVETVRFYRTRRQDDSAVVDKSDTIVTATTQPFHTVNRELLHRVGYVVALHAKVLDERTYHGPDVEELLSDQFIEDHCFAVVSPQASPQGMVGLSFKPTSNRKKIPEIEGTLWLEIATSELRSLEFKYVNLWMPRGIRNVGGKETFKQLPTGGWYINDWMIRIPISGERKSLVYREEGGTARPIAVVAGMVTDRGTGAPISRAILATLNGDIAASDSGGRFLLRSPKSGPAKLAISSPIMSLMGIGALMEEIVFPEPGSMTSVDIRLPIFALARAKGCASMSDTTLAIAFLRIVNQQTDSLISDAKVEFTVGDSTVATGKLVDRAYWGCSLPISGDFSVTIEALGQTHRAGFLMPANRVATLEMTVVPETQGK